MFISISLALVLIKGSYSAIIQDFGFKTSGGQYAGSGEPTELTLVYDSNVYKCRVSPSSISTEYSCQGSTSLIGTNCGDKQEIFLENTDYVAEIDAVIIDYIFITDSDGVKQTIDIDTLCLDRDDCGQNTALVNIDTGVISNKGGSYSTSCSSNVIQSFGFKTTTGQYAGSGEPTELKLIYDSIRYNCMVNPSQINFEYSCDGPASVKEIDCGDNQEMFIENTDYVPEIDAVIINYIFVTDSDGNKDTVSLNGLCLDRDDCGQNTALVNIDSGVISNKGGSYVSSCPSDVIQSFGFKTSGGKYSGSQEPTEITLSFDSVVYQCQVTPTAISTEYSCDGASSLIGTNCFNDNQEMFMENTDYVPEIDAVIIDYIFITGSDGVKQTVSLSNLCLDRDDCGQNTALVNIDSGVISNKGGSYASSCPSDIIQSFGFKTTGGRYAGAGYPTEITLSFDNIIYKCQVTPTAISTEYSCDGSSSIIDTNCVNNNEEMFLENTDYRTTGIDGVIIDYIFITNSDGIKQTVSLSNLCLDVYDCGQNTALVNLGTNAITKGASNSISCDAASLGLPAMNIPHQDYNYNDDLNNKYYINDNGYNYHDYNDYNSYNNNNNNNGEYVISLSSGQMIAILVILMAILSVNIVCMWQKNKNKGYAVIKYDSDFNESEAKAINVRAQ